MTMTLAMTIGYLLLTIVLVHEASSTPLRDAQSSESADNNGLDISGPDAGASAAIQDGDYPLLPLEYDYAAKRTKRSGISDQRLAELETLLALKRLRDQQMKSQSPVAYGVFDPDRIGRRRRRSEPRRTDFGSKFYQLFN
ncbi:hypothetical protein HDE_04779 [Halotydeus destructor]|nr:hypothetical protein HDE_04779 [Halotydeus destructor]